MSPKRIKTEGEMTASSVTKPRARKVASSEVPESVLRQFGSRLTPAASLGYRRQKGDSDLDDDFSGEVTEEKLFDDFKVPMTSETRFAIKKAEAVSETVYEPYIFEDENHLYLLWYKHPKVTLSFKALSTAVEVTVKVSSPTTDEIREVSSAIPEGELAPLEKKFAITLKRRIWQEQGKRIDTTTWSGVQFKINKSVGEEVVYKLHRKRKEKQENRVCRKFNHGESSVSSKVAKQNESKKATLSAPGVTP